MKKYIIIVFLLFIYSAAYSGIEYVEDIQFTLPGFENKFTQLRFNDINNDGYPEVLATDGKFLLVYSISNDSIIFSDSIPEAADNVIDYKILFDDVNRDSVVDIIFGRYSHVDTSMTRTSHLDIYFYNGINFEQNILLDIFIDSLADFYFSSTYIFGLGTIEAVDIDNDGYKEMIISQEKTNVIDNWFTSYVVENTGLTTLFHSFPDSIKWTNEILINGFLPFVKNNGVQSFFTVRYYHEAYDYHGTDPGNFFEVEPALFSPNGLLYDDIFPSSYARGVCLGNIDNSDINTEFISWNFTGGNFLTLVKNTDNFNFEEQWSIPVEGLKITSLIYHPQLPGYFFAFQDNILTLYRGSDGSIHQQVENTPDGSRRWGYPFGDSIPRLILYDSNKISIYHLDIATDIYDDNSELLPDKFSITQNYPNPFNPKTTIKYYLPEKGMVNISVYNLLGQRVENLLDNFQEAGAHEISWDGSDYSSGIYLIKAEYNNQSQSVKAVLLK